VADIQKILGHIRTLCTNDNWPRGELNLPRPLVTEKAYPEDEAVISSTIDEASVSNKVIYEKRFGARNQIELVVPFGFREQEDGWTGGRLGDVALAVKRAFYHSLRRGTIFSMTGEVVLPTGDSDFGKGTTVLEPFATFGQILPADGFLHLQGGAELPLDRDKASEEAFLRAAVGMSFTQGRWGRTWSPMVEVLTARELVSGADVQWDVVPQMQVTLNTRQHVMMNIGVRLPVNDADRDPQLMVYLLWDWFDGGFFEGW
jgi:hypothetical protein